MPWTDDMVRVLRCPFCRGDIAIDGTNLVCRTSADHIFAEDGVTTFARPGGGKYDNEYAARYAALWAFGYATLHCGLDESLYRSVSSLIAESLAEQADARPFIVDAGCGIGRTTGDCARLAPGAAILALDASPSMLALARRIVNGHEPVPVELPTYGFGALSIPAYGAQTPIFARGDVEDLPLIDGCADLVLSINIVDRLPHGPDVALRECHRILRSGGRLIFTDPFNWTEPELWRRYPDAASLLRLLEEIGFRIETWFDDLLYRELLDSRRSTEEFRTVIIKAVKD